MRFPHVHRLAFLLLGFFLVSQLYVAGAQVRSSTNYQIESDSLNIGGGFSSSTNYQQESTVGEIATGVSDSETYNLYAGYQQMQEVFLSLTGASDVVMSPDLPGVLGGESDGSTAVVATTDSRAGYQLSISFSSDPAMQSSASSIDNYTPIGAIPDTNFTTDTNEAHFAFSPYGSDVVDRYRVLAGVCDEAGGVSSTTACWDTPATALQVISESSSSNQPAGATTSVYFKVGVGSNTAQAPGLYIATSTLTLIAL